MKPWLSSVAFLAIALPAAGCSLYFEDSGKADAGVTGCGGISTGQLLRDPSTGQCESFYSPDGDGCYEGDPPAYPPAPNWPTCISVCEGLDEQTCSTTAGCHGYFSGAFCPPNADCISTEPTTFFACGAVGEPISTTSGTACEELDAASCAGSDACQTYLWPTYSGTALTYQFSSCQPEPLPATCWVSSECGPGYDCLNEGGQTPNHDLCDNIFCDVPGTCIPIATGPGSCEGEVTCRLWVPTCPQGTVPGIADGCYTSYCIPSDQCAPPRCASLADEGACDARSDCAPVYEYPPCACEVPGMCNDCMPIYVGCQNLDPPTPGGQGV